MKEKLISKVKTSAAANVKAANRHLVKTFGPGVVLSVEGDVVSVRFSRTGSVKQLMRGFAPLVKIES